MVLPEGAGRVPMTSTMLSTWRQRGLIGILTRREIQGRYRGSVLGMGWPVITPLLMLAVFTLVFGVVFESRWATATAGEPTGMFALRLFAGMLIHGLLAEALGKAPTLVTSQPGYVTKVVFPLEALGWVNLLAAVFHFGIGMGLLVIANGVWGTGFAAAQLALPAIIAPYLLLLLGLGWMLAALAVYIRDIGQAVGPLVMVAMFLGPVFFPRASMPQALQPWLLLNPVTVPIEQARAALFDGSWPDAGTMAVYWLASLAVYAAGLWLFSTLKRGFADVL